MKKISQGDAQKLLAECMVLRESLEKAEATIGKWYRVVSRRERMVADLQAEIIRLKIELEDRELVIAELREAVRQYFYIGAEKAILEKFTEQNRRFKKAEQELRRLAGKGGEDG